MVNTEKVEEDYSATTKKYEKIFNNSLTKCPYGLQEKAIFKEIAVSSIDQDIFDCFVLSGYRRAGRLLYTTNCPDCEKCIPIRITPSSVQFNRSQKRIRKKNIQLRAVLGHPTFTEEKLNMYAHFLQARYAKSTHPTERDYKEFFIHSCTSTYEICYYQGKELVGVSTVDITRRLVNAVYFFFNPKYQKNQLGIYNIIYLTELCITEGIECLVTGYLIKELSSMNYKGTFYPHDLLINNKWVSQKKDSLSK